MNSRYLLLRQKFASLILAILAFPAIASQPLISIDSIGLANYSSYEILKKNGFKPRSNVDSWPFSVPIEWNADPFQDVNWQFQLHAWRLIDPIIIEYDKTKNPDLLNEILAIVTDWYDYHFIKYQVSNMQWYDMAIGINIEIMSPPQAHITPCR
jgi:hypothetical protein